MTGGFDSYMPGGGGVGGGFDSYMPGGGASSTGGIGGAAPPEGA